MGEVACGQRVGESGEIAPDAPQGLSGRGVVPVAITGDEVAGVQQARCGQDADQDSVGRTRQGALAFAGISLYMRETRITATTRLDWLGFGSLSVAIAAMQVFLDRNFSVGMFFIFIVGVTYLASMALMTP